MPFSPLYLLLLILLFAFLLAFIQVGLLAIAFEKLGLSPDSGLLQLFSALFGSLINLPVARVSAEEPQTPPPVWVGLLIGADLLRLKDVRQLGAPIASIGGAGTFDGIFMTGIVAALLA
jgi:uncharacterized membrane protein